MARPFAHKAGVSLKWVKSISVRFCPFESNVESTRHFLECVFARKAYKTNMNCDVKTEVRHDGSEPIIDVTFVDGEKLIMKAANLTIRDMLDVFKSKCELRDLKS
uniref:Large ribosomal subunit protein mL53 n=1 Tax=Pogona vitticeps TaxID=103695 RepID=A0A6J0T3K4_9SAUR|nr:39S ribosomal protein L53, mitochondrial [Pogona vitticeps]